MHAHNTALHDKHSHSKGIIIVMMKKGAMQEEIPLLCERLSCSVVLCACIRAQCNDRESTDPLISVTTPWVSEQNSTYHSQPNSLSLRTDLLIKSSADDGQTWQQLAAPWQGGSAGYSALVVLGDEADAPLGLLYAQYKYKTKNMLTNEYLSQLSRIQQLCAYSRHSRFSEQSYTI